MNNSGSTSIVQRLVPTAVATGALLVLLASVSFATIPDSAGLIRACVKRSNGTVRIIDPAADSCTKEESPVSWSQNGQPGPEGRAGSPGTEGPAGPAGPMGPMGEVGPMGPAGPMGEVGPMGPAGPMGEVGPMGPMGPEGPMGEVGPMGPMGPMGPEGPLGPMGPMGPAGTAGPEGATGPMGPMGPGGAQGATGPMGPMGPGGAQGATGPAGPQGATGAQGPAGAPGLSGYVVVQRTFQLVPDSTAIIDVSCAAGKFVLSAGSRSTSFNYGLIVAGDYPISATTWRFELKNPFSAWNNGILFAVCATVAA